MAWPPHFGLNEVGQAHGVLRGCHSTHGRYHKMVAPATHRMMLPAYIQKLQD